VTPAPIAVFAVEDRAVQLHWPFLDVAELTVEVGDRTELLRAEALGRPTRWSRPRRSRAGGPGTLLVEGLEPGTAYEVVVSIPGRARFSAARFTTLEPPPGRLLSRFATISDLHLGERRFGVLGTICEPRSGPGGPDPYPLRSARAALDEVGAWDAELVVVKGDITWDSLQKEFEQAGRLLAGSAVPVAAILGNHDVRRQAAPMGVRVLAEHGIEVSTSPRAIDLPGVRIVLGHSPIPDDRRGRLGEAQTAELVTLVAEADGAVVVMLHHPPQRTTVPTHYPPGLTKPESTRLLAQLNEANPATVVLVGHSHRNRLERSGSIPVAEVGSTKDYPGVWAGYAVHEGGIRQVLRRIGRPDVIAWTEATKAALGGRWGRWTPGRLDERCWSHPWPTGGDRSHPWEAGPSTAVSATRAVAPDHG
jgi:predicted phosphodiesterase